MTKTKRKLLMKEKKSNGNNRLPMKKKEKKSNGNNRLPIKEEIKIQEIITQYIIKNRDEYLQRERMKISKLNKENNIVDKQENVKK